MTIGLTKQELKELSSFGQTPQEFADKIYGTKSETHTLPEVFDHLV